MLGDAISPYIIGAVGFFYLVHFLQSFGICSCSGVRLDSWFRRYTFMATFIRCRRLCTFPTLCSLSAAVSSSCLLCIWSVIDGKQTKQCMVRLCYVPFNYWISSIPFISESTHLASTQSSGLTPPLADDFASWTNDGSVLTLLFVYQCFGCSRCAIICKECFDKLWMI